MRLPSGWEKTRDESGRIDNIKDEMSRDSGSDVSVVLSYEKTGGDMVPPKKVDVMMEEDIGGGFEYYWRYDDQSGGQLEYEYDVFGDTLSEFDKAKSSAIKKVEVVESNSD